LLSISSTQAAEDITIRLTFTPFAAHAAFYVAEAKGYYDEAGLNASILPGRGSTFAATAVGSGQDTFGIADAAAVVQARAKDVPVVAIASLAQDNGVALIATEKSGINSPAEMKGRNIGLFPGSTTVIFLESVLNQNGLTMDDIKPVTVRSGTDLPLILDGSMDAEVSIYSQVLAWQIQHPELKLKFWQMKDLGLATPGYTLISSASYVQSKPEVVKAFVQATLKGQQYALDHPEEAIDILVKSVPELRADEEMIKWKEVANITLSDYTTANGIGAIDTAKWEQLNEMLTKYKAIEKPIDLAPALLDNFRK
jgi:NitT/TauT family transport system substrate-binding protein